MIRKIADPEDVGRYDRARDGCWNFGIPGGIFDLDPVSLGRSGPPFIYIWIFKPPIPI